MRKAGFLSIAIGTLLIIAALLLSLYNKQEDRRAGQSAETGLDVVQTAIEERQAHTQQAVPASDAEIETLQEENIQEEVTLLDGYSYIGILTLPSLEVKLPVLSDCSEIILKIAPCRDYGSLRDDNLVIAAHNYQNHFGRLAQIAYGDDVYFTDMTGEKHRYQVGQITMLHPTDVKLVTESDYELVLYTCDYSNQNRIAVYCRKVTE